MSKYEVNTSSSFLLICETDDSGSSGSRGPQSIYSTCFADGNIMSLFGLRAVGCRSWKWPTFGAKNHGRSLESEWSCSVIGLLSGNKVNTTFFLTHLFALAWIGKFWKSQIILQSFWIRLQWKPAISHTLPVSVIRIIWKELFIQFMKKTINHLMKHKLFHIWMNCSIWNFKEIRILNCPIESVWTLVL